MKKIFIGILLLSGVLLVGCNKPPVEDVVDNQEQVVEEEVTSVEVEKEIFDVSITIPKDLVGEDMTQEYLNQVCEEKGYQSATLNADGSVTYVMTRSQHKEIMKEMKETIDQTLDDMIQSEGLPTITDIKTNSDYTKFTITTTSNELTLSESFSVLTFYMCGGMYNNYNGTSVDDIETIWINADTGEEIAHTSLKAMAEQQE